jgi:hypothetical protein
MDAGPPGFVGRANDVSRRRLLQLAGGVGLVAAVGGCARDSDTETTARATSSTTAAPAGQPPEPSASPAAATSAILLCRDAWGARPARPGGRPHTITRMTLHHTAVLLGDNRHAPARLRQHQQYHQDDHGWIDIAYHVSVDRNGNIYQLRTPELAGDTATEYDPTGHFLVLCEGDFDQETVSEAQLHSAAVAFAWAAQNFHITSETLAGHRDVASTSCPGADLYAHVSTGDLRGRIDDLLAAGAVDLQRLCGPEAAAIVAEIEQGR